jgi:tellurite resistance protein
MTDQERQALLTLAIMAAFADDRNDAAERDEVKRVADSLSRESDINVAALYQDVLLKRATLDSAVSVLASPETRRLAYELSVGVCNADGALSDGERTFLYALETRLGFDHAETAAARAITEESEALAAAPLVEAPPTPESAAGAAAAEPDHDRMIVSVDRRAQGRVERYSIQVP